MTFTIFVNSNSAQSSDLDNPTPLSSKELKGSLGGANKELNFSATKAEDILVMPLATYRGSKRETNSFELDERQSVVMKPASTGSYRGNYSIRLDGIVDFKSDVSASTTTREKSYHCDNAGKLEQCFFRELFAEKRNFNFYDEQRHSKGNQSRRRSKSFP
ncbi:MAG TPA: hypothetical protein VF556_11165 [Pyrinomonadaceae bacterium]